MPRTTQKVPLDNEQIPTISPADLANPSKRDQFMVSLAHCGASYTDIANTVKLSRERVRQILNANGIERKAATEKVHNTIRQLASKGNLTVSDIATAIGKPEDYVDHFCRQHRLHVPRQLKYAPDGSFTIRKKPMDILPEVRRLVAEGLTTSQIAVQLNQPYHSIYSLRGRNHL